jgi:hypothetical protein
VLSHPALEPLTDIFAIPRGIPFANVFSVGDILLGAGVFILIVVMMRRGRAQEPASPILDGPIAAPGASTH